MSDLPPGFELEDDHSALPPGFVIEGEQPALTAGEKAVDAYKGLGTGALKGTLALGGMVGDLTNLGAKGIEKASNAVSDALGVERYQRPETPSALNAIPTTQSLTDQLKGALGEDFYQPQSDYGKAAESVGEFIPGAAATAATGGGSLAGNVARYAVAPGLATFTAQKALPDTDYKPWLVAGAGVGASMLNPARAITPFPASPARQAAVDTLANEGVTSLTAGQRTGNQGLRYIEDAASHAPMAGQGASRIEGEGQRQFTEAAMRRTGAAASEATPEVLAANQARLGQSFRDLSARNSLIPDNQFVSDIVQAAKDYKVAPPSTQKASVQGYIDDLIGHVNNGQMPGPQYQNMRSELSRKANSLAQSDPTLSDAYRSMRNALDNGMERSIANNNPQDLGAWVTTRQQYGAQKLIEKSASKAGEATAEGQITPANLRNTIPKAGGGYARGEGQFSELARAGANVMTPLPNSGTAQRMNAFHILNSALGGIPQALAGRAIMSRPAQDLLANQLMTGALPTNPTARRLLMIEALQRGGNGSGITIRPGQPPAETQ